MRQTGSKDLAWLDRVLAAIKGEPFMSQIRIQIGGFGPKAAHSFVIR